MKQLQLIDQSQLTVFQQNQIQKTIFQILQQKDLFDLLDQSEIDQTISSIEETVQKIGTELDLIMAAGQLNQGVNVISQKVQQLNQILGKNLETLDGVISTVTKKIDSANSRRRELDQTQNYETLKSVQETQKLIIQSVLKTKLPNQDPINYEGGAMSTTTFTATNKFAKSVFLLTNE